MKYLSFTIIALGVFLTLYACKQNNDHQTAKQPTMADVQIEAFEKAIADKEHTILLDVRTTKEFDGGHIANAINIDVKEDSFRKECVKQLPKGKVVAVYCRSGFRSRSAGHILNEEGFDVINLKGGIIAWEEAGKEVVR